MLTLMQKENGGKQNRFCSQSLFRYMLGLKTKTDAVPIGIFSYITVLIPKNARNALS